MNRLSFTLLLLLLCSIGLNIYQFTNNTVQTVVQQSPLSFINDNKTPRTTEKTVAVTNISEDPAEASQESDLTKKDIAQTFFDRGQYQEAFELYEQLLKEDEVAAMDLHRVWLETLKDRLKAKQLDDIDPFLEVFLTGYPYDQKYLALKAETRVAFGQINAALNIYYALMDYAIEVSDEEYYQARIRHIAGERVDVLAKEQAWQGVIDFVEPLLVQEPTFPPYLLAQAQALIKLGQLDSAEQILDPLLDISYYRERAQSMLNEINRARLQLTSIKLQPIGEHYLVGGLIDNSSEVKLMIDTGASISVLTQDMFNQVESWSAPEYIQDIPLNTAGGRVNAPVYRFERFQIDAFYVDNMEFVVLPLENASGYNGLLGMNFLKHFKFEIDQENNLLILSP